MIMTWWIGIQTEVMARGLILLEEQDLNILEQGRYAHRWLEANFEPSVFGVLYNHHRITCLLLTIAEPTEPTDQHR